MSLNLKQLMKVSNKRFDVKNVPSKEFFMCCTLEEEMKIRDYYYSETVILEAGTQIIVKPMNNKFKMFIFNRDSNNIDFYEMKSYEEYFMRILRVSHIKILHLDDVKELAGNYNNYDIATNSLVKGE